jgi:hypothetical protein
MIFRSIGHIPTKIIRQAISFSPKNDFSELSGIERARPFTL